MQILKLLPEQISRHWDIVAYAIGQTVGTQYELSEEMALKYTEMLVSGRVQCWAVYEKGKMPNGLMAFIFTSIVADELLGSNTLRILGLYVMDMESAANMDVWKEGLQHLAKFASANKCVSVSFLTDQPALLRISKELGATTTLTYGEFRLPK